MSWTISKDHTGNNREGISGTGKDVDKTTPDAEQFHTFDDDGDPAFSGWLVDDDACPVYGCAWESALSFAEYDVGATTIKDHRGETVIA